MSSFKDVPLAVKITIPNVFTHMPCESYVEMGRGGGLETGSFSQVLFLSLKSRASLGVIGCVVVVFLWFGCRLKNKQMFKWVTTIHRELGSWTWGCGSWLQVLYNG